VFDYCFTSFCSFLAGERTAIVTVVCANANLPNLEVRVAAYQVLVEIARLYYVHLPSFMQVLFNMTLKTIKTDEELPAQQAIEFWATIAEVELELQREMDDFGKTQHQAHHFVKGSVKFLAPVLMETLCKQDEDPESEDWNAQKAAATCLRLVASLVRDDVVQWVMPFVTNNISHANWRPREAAVLAFGCILDGPSTQCLTAIINHAMVVLIKHMTDKEQIVRDTTAWTIGAICELHPTLAKEYVQQLMSCLVDHLQEKPAVAAQVCYAIHYLAEAFEDERDNATSPLSRYFQGVVQKLTICCDRKDLDEANLRAAIYEALNSMIASVAQDQLQLVGSLVPLFLTRLDATAKMDDKNAAADLQALICGVLLAITSRLGDRVRAFSDELMRRLLAVFSTPVARVHEEALLAIAGLANALGANFDRYAATPYLQQVIVKALRSTDDSHVASVAVSLVSDMSIALDEKMLPYCDMLMTVLLQNLQSAELDREIKPSILSCVGDIALAITGSFEKYLPAVMHVLQQASQTRVLDQTDLEFVDYVDSLREGVFEAYSGILHGLSTAKKAQLFAPYLQHAVAFVEFITNEAPEIRDNVLHAGVSFIGDVGKCLGPPGIQLFQNRDPIRRFVQLAASSKDPKTSEAAEWAKSKLTGRP
jgi:importin subunit beta-1